MTGTRPPLLWTDLGLVPFPDADFLQSELAERRAALASDFLIFAEHPPAYTFGARAQHSGVLWPESFLAGRGIPRYLTSRGGDPVYHAPGQLAAYTIFDTGTHELGARSFVALLERALMLVLRDFGLDAVGTGPLPGLWVEGRQLASVGVHLSRGISRYGFTLNVSPDLSPCVETPSGKLAVTSLERLGRKADVHALAPRIAAAFGVVFHQRVTRLEPADIRAFSRE